MVTGELLELRVEVQKPARLDALTGLRCFAALNIVFFHFGDPKSFGPLAPVVDAGYLSVSFFIMLSGFVLAYNYAGRAREGKLDRVRFWKARFTRLYPVYLLSLILGWQTLAGERASHTTGDFWLGITLTPLLLQGWFPKIATFWNTPAWTMSAEAAYYVFFPWIASLKPPPKLSGHLWRLAALWFLGMIPGVLYVIFNPDHLAYVDRISTGYWLEALKATPLPHLPSFVFGVLLASLDEVIERTGLFRLWLGLFGFVGIYTILVLHPPYALIHDGLLMPLFGCLILGLSGINPLSKLLGFTGFVLIGESSYCLYLIHFNVWNMLDLNRYSRWISYPTIVAMGMLTLYLVEKPAQKLLRRWMKA